MPPNEKRKRESLRRTRTLVDAASAGANVRVLIIFLDNKTVHTAPFSVLAIIISFRLNVTDGAASINDARLLVNCVRSSRRINRDRSGIKVSVVLAFYSFAHHYSQILRYYVLDFIAVRRDRMASR